MNSPRATRSTRRTKNKALSQLNEPCSSPIPPSPNVSKLTSVISSATTDPNDPEYLKQKIKDLETQVASKNQETQIYKDRWKQNDNILDIYSKFGQVNCQDEAIKETVKEYNVHRLEFNSEYDKTLGRESPLFGRISSGSSLVPPTPVPSESLQPQRSTRAKKRALVVDPSAQDELAAAQKSKITQSASGLLTLHVSDDEEPADVTVNIVNDNQPHYGGPVTSSSRPKNKNGEKVEISTPPATYPNLISHSEMQSVNNTSPFSLKGSMKLQEKYKSSDVNMKNLIFDKCRIAPLMMTHVYGTYLIQLMLSEKDGLPEHRNYFLTETIMAFDKLALDEIGHHVIRIAIKNCAGYETETNYKIKLIEAIGNKLLYYANNRYGSLILKSILECQDYKASKLLAEKALPYIRILAKNVIGHNLVQNLIAQNFLPEDKLGNEVNMIKNTIFDNLVELTFDDSGCFVVGFLCQKGTKADLQRLQHFSKSQFYDMTTHKNASKIIQKILTFGDADIKKHLIFNVLTNDELLSKLCQSRYALNILIKMVDLAKGNTRKCFVFKIEAEGKKMGNHSWNKMFLRKLNAYKK